MTTSTTARSPAANSPTPNIAASSNATVSRPTVNGAAAAAPPPISIPTLQATAARLLPGMRHARSLLDVSIRVLEYFERHAALEAASGKLNALPEAGPNLIAEAENVKALLSAFDRLRGKSH